MATTKPNHFHQNHLKKKAMNQQFNIRNANDICKDIDQVPFNTPCSQMFQVSQWNILPSANNSDCLCLIGSAATHIGTFIDFVTQEEYELESEGFIGTRPNNPR